MLREALVTLVFGALFVLAIAVPIVGYYQDKAYLNNASLCKDISFKNIVAKGHLTVKTAVLFSKFALCLASAMIEMAKKLGKSSRGLLGHKC